MSYGNVLLVVICACRNIADSKNRINLGRPCGGVTGHRKSSVPITNRQKTWTWKVGRPSPDGSAASRNRRNHRESLLFRRACIESHLTVNRIPVIENRELGDRKSTRLNSSH